MPEIADEITLRSLAYLAAMSQHGDGITAAELDRYASEPLPGVGSMFSVVTRFSTLGGVNVAHYIQRVGWAVEVGGRLHISGTGAAVLVASGAVAPAQAAAIEPLEIVVRPDDPFTYVQMLREIAKLDDVMIIDPYLPSPDLEALVRYPNVKRVLTIDADVVGEKKSVRRTNLANVLGATDHPVELRVDKTTTPKRLHDRLVLPSRGSALTMGASLGALQPTALVHVGEGTTDVLRTHYEAIWATSEKLEPSQLPRSEPSAAEAAPEA